MITAMIECRGRGKADSQLVYLREYVDLNRVPQLVGNIVDSSRNESAAGRRRRPPFESRGSVECALFALNVSTVLAEKTSCRMLPMSVTVVHSRSWARFGRVRSSRRSRHRSSLASGDRRALSELFSCQSTLAAEATPQPPTAERVYHTHAGYRSIEWSLPVISTIYSVPKFLHRLDCPKLHDSTS